MPEGPSKTAHAELMAATANLQTAIAKMLAVVEEVTAFEAREALREAPRETPPAPQ